MSLLPEFVYQGVLPDCFSQITNWFLLLTDLSSLLATNSPFAVFQPVFHTLSWTGVPSVPAYTMAFPLLVLLF